MLMQTFPYQGNPEKSVMEIARRYDWKHGGWGRAPKFPQPMTIEFLLQRASGEIIGIGIWRFMPRFHGKRGNV
jgi:hypothetical protein